MKLLRKLPRLAREDGPVILAAGFFDGVHLGHRRVIDRTRRRAQRVNGQAWVLTFDTHPLKVLRPAAAPPLLTSNRHKLGILARMGIRGCLLLPFTRRTARTEPETFIRQLGACAPTLAEILVGENWRFGRGGRGTPELLAAWGRRLGLRVTVVRPAQRRGHAISSTRIRTAVRHGDLREAAALLGRPFSVLGVVRRGRTVGRRLGFPTANIEWGNEVLPPGGVYAVRAAIGPRANGAARTVRTFDGVANLGVRPTFGREGCPRQTLELHLLDFHGDLYGREIEVFFMRKIRNERRFKSEALLAQQIAMDAADARAILRRR